MSKILTLLLLNNIESTFRAVGHFGFEIQHSFPVLHSKENSFKSISDFVLLKNDDYAKGLSVVILFVKKLLFYFNQKLIQLLTFIIYCAILAERNTRS